MSDAAVVMSGPNMTPAIFTAVGWSVPSSFDETISRSTADAMITSLSLRSSPMPIKYEWEVWSKMGNSPDQKVRTFMVEANARKFAADLRKAHKKSFPKVKSTVRVKKVSYRA